MNRYTYILFFLFLFTTSSFAQIPTATIGTAKSCANQEVLVNITASNLLNIGAITLYFDIDTNKLIFLSIENIDSQLTHDLLFNFIKNPPKIAVVWNNIVSANFPQTKLFDLKFKVKETNTTVSFAGGCEIATSNYQVLGLNWMNGSVESANPVILTQPKNLTTTETKNASFEVTSADATEYQWEISQNGTSWQVIQEGGNYSGTLTNVLSITNVPVSFSKNQYRCILSNGPCQTLSDIGILTVGSSSSINEGMNLRDFQFKIQPNPFTENSQIAYTLPEEGNVHIRIYTVVGTQAMDLQNEFQLKGQYKIPFSGLGLQRGVYFCQFEFKNMNNIISLGQKMIKN